MVLVVTPYLNQYIGLHFLFFYIALCLHGIAGIHVFDTRLGCVSSSLVGQVNKVNYKQNGSLQDFVIARGLYSHNLDWW
jgi:hypothetical protein